MAPESSFLKRSAWLAPLMGLVLFAAALFLLHHELKEYHYHAVLHALEELPLHKALLAILLTGASYWILTLYDWLGLHYIGRRLSYPRAAFASFLGYVFSHNLGLNVLGGSAARYRIYSVWGLSAIEVASIVLFCGLTFWLGFGVVAGVVFLVAPVSLPAFVPLASVRPVGVLCLTLVVIYVVAAALWRKPLRIRRWDFRLPSLWLALGQVAVSTLDWIAAASVFFVLLPSTGLSFLTVVGVFMVAQLAGLISHLPGGFGVFETVSVVILSPTIPPPTILAALVAYRVVYYLLPLFAGVIGLAAFEALHRRKHLVGAFKAAKRWLPAVVPNVFALALLVGGLVLLFSGATPAAVHRLPRLALVIPLPVIEFSHFLGSIVGVGLILIARGLQRRLEGAYVVAVLFLVTGAIVSILKGLDYEEAILLGVLLAALLPCRHYFYRKSSLLSQRFTPGWVVTIAVAVGASIWLGFFSYKHVEYSDELWWRFSLAGNAPRFLRATAGVLATLVLFSLAKLLKPVAPRPQPPGSIDWGDVGRVVAACPQTYASLAFLGDKRFLFNESRDGFVMYGIEGRSWVCMGDPVAPLAARMDLIWRFRELCDRHSGWSVFYEVDDANLRLYLNGGLLLQKIGEEARVPLADFSLEGNERKELRHSEKRPEKEGCTFRVLDPEAGRARLSELRRISDEWLESKHTREKCFSLGSFRDEYLARFPIAIVEQAGRLIAFANVWTGSNKEELSPDLMRHVTDAPKGIMDYLFVQLMFWGRAEGYNWFNLGMAPLAGLESRPLAPVWNRLGALLFRHGEHFYNFQGLRKYKDKFHPVWNAKYLAAPANAMIPRVLMNIASLTAGGLKGSIAK